MQGHGHNVARSILRNSAALFVVGLFSKAMGLVLAVLVARFLGPDAMGLFAVLFSVTLLTENIAALGLQDLLLREVAAHPDRRRGLWRQGARLAAASGLVFCVGFLAAAWLEGDNESLRRSLIAIALGIPLATVFGVSQAVMQGMEEVLHLVWMTFLTRIVSLLWLTWALFQGAGVEAAFYSRVMFLLLAVALFLVVILRKSPSEEAAPAGRLLRRALPLAANRGLAELSNRAPVLLMPALLGLHATGLFDAADRFRQTLTMAISVGITSVMPSFARSFQQADDSREALVGHTVKYTVLLIGLVAVALCVLAEPLILLLYGARFRDSILPMQVLVWAQVAISADAMLKQAMVAGHHEHVVPKIALLGTIVLAGLVVALALKLGTLGVAVAVVAGAVFTMVADLLYTNRHVVHIDVLESIGKPAICLGATAAMLFLLQDASLWQRAAVALLTLAVTGALTRVLPHGERSFLWNLVTKSRAGRANIGTG